MKVLSECLFTRYAKKDTERRYCFGGKESQKPHKGIIQETPGERLAFRKAVSQEL